MLGQNIIVIWIKNNMLQIMSSGAETATSLPIPATIIAHLEVINRDELFTLVKNWVKTQTYKSSQIIWLLDTEVYFDKLLPDSDKQNWDQETVKFLEAVPFEAIASRLYTRLGEGKWVVATNKDLLQALVHAFAIQGYGTLAEVPVKFIKEIDITQGLTQNAYKQTVNRSNELIQNRMLVEEEQIKMKNVDQKSTTGVSKPKSQLPLLLSIFGVLLLVLGIVAYLQFGR